MKKNKPLEGPPSAMTWLLIVGALGLVACGGPRVSVPVASVASGEARAAPPRQIQGRLAPGAACLEGAPRDTLRDVALQGGLLRFCLGPEEARPGDVDCWSVDLARGLYSPAPLPAPAPAPEVATSLTRQVLSLCREGGCVQVEAPWARPACADQVRGQINPAGDRALVTYQDGEHCQNPALALYDLSSRAQLWSRAVAPPGEDLCTGQLGFLPGGRVYLGLGVCAGPEEAPLIFAQSGGQLLALGVSPEHSRAARFQGAALLPEGVLNTWGAAPGASGDVAFFLDSAGAQLFPYDVGQDAWGRPIGLGLGGDAGVGAARLVVGPEGLVVVTGAPAGDVVLVDPASRRVTGRIQAPRCPR